MKVLVTGAAGFIGFHAVRSLLERGDEVVGLDSINDYYDPELKYDRLAVTGILREEIDRGGMCRSHRYDRYRFVRMNVEERGSLPELFARERFDAVCHLAAQAGVRYSIENPWAYIDSNIAGFMNVLECCRHYPVQHLVYASSSSVYGSNDKVPYSEADMVDSPVSLYAATKKSNELMAHAYAKLYGIPVTGLRFFTVYGPWGRPDMSPMLFARAIASGEPVKVFNHGNMSRDFTYVDDIVEGVVRVLDRAPQDSVPCRVYNIGASQPVDLMEFIRTIEEAMGRKAEKIMLPMQPGDVSRTWADTSRLEADFGYRPATTLREGIGRFIRWYSDYFGTELP